VSLPRNRQKLCCCRFRNRQRRWSHFSLVFFFVGCLHWASWIDPKLKRKTTYWVYKSYVA
jgi:hypothetical protein